MSFHSVNEINQFSFEDCIIKKFAKEEKGICLELEALIVRPTNSQNSNFTESYAGPTQAHLTDGCVLKVIKDGYKYLDANDKVVEEFPDVELTEAEAEALLRSCGDYYFYGMEQRSFENGVYYYVCGLEAPNAEAYDTNPTDTYRIEMSFTKAEFVWKQYMNRVQR